MTVVRIALEIDDDASPLQGRLTARPGFERAFTGWIGLLSALQDAIVPADAARPRNPEAMPDRSGLLDPAPSPKAR
jgi:hypothetical protein